MNRFKSLSRLGTKTYGLYLIHPIAISFVTVLTRRFYKHFGGSLPLIAFFDILSAFILTVVLANLSFKYFEKPFLTIKNRFAYSN